MNKKYALPAIVMFAVVMGMSAFAPALAQPEPKTYLCHFDEDEGLWMVIKVNMNSLEGHSNHDDFMIPSQSTVDLCLAQTPGLPE